MNLTTLLAPLEKYDTLGTIDVEITGLSYDSRKVQQGYLFAALPGLRQHGTEFLKEAQNAGAAAILTDRKINTELPLIIVSNPRLALAKMSSAFYQQPTSRLDVFGVTGTNGKTTCTFLLNSVLENAGFRTGLIGTIQYCGKGFTAPARLTTPESLDLQELLATMVSEGCNACAMEVSSHSLKQYRVAGCNFRAAIFTNLTQDHLDYHQNMEEYFRAKQMLFDEQSCHVQIAVINADDSYGQRLLSERKALSYGFAETADYRIVRWESSVDGSEIMIHHNGGEVTLDSPLIGRFNAYNIAAVFAATHATGIMEQAIVSGIRQIGQVPGRMERIDHGQPYLLLIDYAHTEDALRQLLATVRPYVKNKLTVLFGCGGDRDPGKRSCMGRAAGELADAVILTSDNPRTEDPENIIRQIQEGVQQSGNKNLRIFPDRREAIQYAVQKAEPGDAIILAGKGHEEYQIIGEQKFYFSEREILNDFLAAKKI